MNNETSIDTLNLILNRIQLSIVVIYIDNQH